MIELEVSGLGAVSPAGWGVGPLQDAWARREAVADATMPRPGWSRSLTVRRVPPPPQRPAFLTHPRLRRASPISHFALAASLEALGQSLFAPIAPPDSNHRLGLVFCTMTGSVVYSRRFYEEVRSNPATASPLLFPETVYNAPASHVAAVLGLIERVHTEVGDRTCTLQALNTAALWLTTGVVDRCLIVAAEEADWLSADGLALRSRRRTASEGAGALLLQRAGSFPSIARVRLLDEHFPESAPSLPGLQDVPGLLGEAWAAATAWQCVVAASGVATGTVSDIIVSVTDIGRRVVRAQFSAPLEPPLPGATSPVP